MTDAEPRPLRVAFHTLGCRLNQVDTEGMKAAMRAARPITVVNWGDEADVYVLNSCTVTTRADQETRRLARRVKREHPQARVVVAGCYAQAQPQALATVREIDAVIGNTARDDVATWLPLVLAAPGDAPRLVVASFARRERFAAPSIAGFTGRSRAYVKVQDGCDLRCSYCLIWQARGPGRSRPIDDVLAQVGALHAGAAYHEVILTGVHLGSYGRDLGPGAPRLVDLVRAVLAAFPRLRVRLGSLHPDELTPELARLLAEESRLRPHLHISLQSGSDTVLARMARPYRATAAQQAIASVADTIANLGLGADVIVGFPGETDAEFAETLACVESLPFTYLHVFRFSPRPGTPAARLADPVPPQIVTERAAVLREAARRRTVAFQRSLLGTAREAIVENERAARPGHRRATTDNYVPVLVAADPAADAPAAGTPVRVTPCKWSGGRLFADSFETLLETNP